jgi:hypothetical protein
MCFALFLELESSQKEQKAYQRDKSTPSTKTKRFSSSRREFDPLKGTVKKFG